jgi:hypothetical protein
MKRAIELVLTALKHIGHPLFFALATASLLWGASQQVCSPTVAILLMTFIGFVTGFRFALTTFTHIIVKHPEFIRQTVEEWKNDGRWEQLLAYVARRRYGR